ncbi:MAG: glycosyltransferase family 4 protein [Bacteroidales bacterium]
MKKVLIITYYWPPSGGSPVLRWLRFTKYAREHGWEPVIYTVDDGEYPETDLSLEKDLPAGLTVLKRPALEPYSLYKRFTGQKKHQKIQTGFLSEKKKPSLAESFAIWVRGNFFIPDARMLWIRPSARYLLSWLRDHPVDLVVSTGPPHSCHRIALRLKKKMGIKWVADFRDPWTKIDWYDKLKLTPLADHRHHQLEREVLKTADLITTVSWEMASDFRQMGARGVEVVTNGFDADDFRDVDTPPDPGFVILHTGSLNKDRNPKEFFSAIKILRDQNASFASLFKLRLIGKSDHAVMECIEETGLMDCTESIPFVPHNQIPSELRKASLLLLPLNNTINAKGILTGKLFEYLASGRKILGIGPVDGDAARVLDETGAGKMVPFGNTEMMKEALQLYFEDYLTGQIHSPGRGTENYSWERLASKLGSLFRSLI